MALFASSYIKTTTAVDTRTRDQLSAVLTSRPQAMTVYVRFAEMGTILIASARLLQIGTAADPRLAIVSTGTNYQVFYDNGPAAVTSTLAVAPVIGDTVELLAALSGVGAVQIAQSINAGSITTAALSGTLTMKDVWSSPILWFNSQITGQVGFCAFSHVDLRRGNLSFERARQLAGVA